MFGIKTSRHFLSQSAVNPKPTPVTGGHFTGLHVSNKYLSHAWKTTANQEPRKPLHILRFATGCIPRKFPSVHYGLQVFPFNACSLRRHLLFSSVWILQMQNQIMTFSRLNLRQNLILKAEYFMQTSRNLKKNDQNPGTARRVSIRKSFVTFAQRKCSEAKILNDL